MATTTPTLAAVVSNYNYGRFLPDALDSLLEQEPPFDQIIVVDDGSTDNSAEVLARYGDRVQVIVQRNQGQIAACLTGMNAATTDYVYLLDADDYAAPGLVASVRPALESWPAKVQFQLEGVDTNRRPLESVFPTYPPNYDATKMREDNRTLGFYQCPPTSGNVVHRQKFLDVGLNPAARPPHIDATGILMQPYLGEVISISERLGYYRQHGSNNFCTTWNQPTVEQLQKELTEFRQSWDEAIRVLNMNATPFADGAPLFVRERQLMIAALEGRWWILPEVARFTLQVWRTHLPFYWKLLLSNWSALLLIPVPALRRKFIDQRRNPGKRSAFVRSIIRNCRRLASRSSQSSSKTAPA